MMLAATTKPIPATTRDCATGHARSASRLGSLSPSGGRATGPWRSLPRL